MNTENEYRRICNGQRNRPCSGLRRTVQPAHCPACPGVRRVQRGAALFRVHGQNPLFRSQGDHLHRRTQQRIPGGRAQVRPGDLLSRHPHSGHLLRLPAHGPYAGRQGGHRSRQRIRQNRGGDRRLLCPLCRCGSHHRLLYEPYGLYFQAPPGFPLRCTHPRVPRGCHGMPRKEALCHPVPPRGRPHPPGADHAPQFRAADLRLRRGLADGFLREVHHRVPARHHRQRQGAVRPVRRCGFLRGGGAFEPCRGQAAHLRVCGSRSAPQE